MFNFVFVDFGLVLKAEGQRYSSLFHWLLGTFIFTKETRMEDAEVITVSSSEDDEYVPQHRTYPPVRTRRNPRDSVQVVHISNSSFTPPKLGKHEVTKGVPSGPSMVVNGSSRTPVQVPDDDVITVSDSDDEQIQPVTPQSHSLTLQCTTTFISRLSML